MRSVDVAVRKRNIDPNRIERAISGIVRQLESLGNQRFLQKNWASCDGSIKRIDDIAYIRFASVYRDFRNASDFHDIIDELSKGVADTESHFDE